MSQDPSKFLVIAESTDLPNHWGIYTAIGSVLAAAIALLYRTLETRNAKDIADLQAAVKASNDKGDKCEEERAELKAKCAAFEAELVYVRMRVDELLMESREAKENCKRNA